jgi:pantoate ligase/cytidylate kinase
MLVFNSAADLQFHLQSLKYDHSIGLVPTMGALHSGHVSLIERAIAENKVVVVSIFVNPLQFAANEDLSRYPCQLEADLQICEVLGVNCVFAPSTRELYQNQEVFRVLPPKALTSVLCGKFRPGHFEGVATIVTKLFNIVQPNRAYFGEKDAQQLAIIRRLVQDLNISVEVISCPIIRESSGLALSSRNQYLSPEERDLAVSLSRGLFAAKSVFEQGEFRSEKLISVVKNELINLKIEYVELVHPDTLQPLTLVKDRGLLAIAAKIGATRLIDNIMLKKRQPIIAIDGPAGAGKSTVTRKIAEKLGLLYLDTGAMYRAITWLFLQKGISLDDQNAVFNLVNNVSLKLISNNQELQVIINGQNVTKAIRNPEVTAKVSTISAQKIVREKMVKLQKEWGQKGGIIAEGRDLCTQVFPDAELKIFLTASVEERAGRRLKDFQNQGIVGLTFEQLQEDIKNRDYQDSNREISPLKKAEDAIEIITDDLTIDEVINKIINLYSDLSISPKT